MLGKEEENLKVYLEEEKPYSLQSIVYKYACVQAKKQIAIGRAGSFKSPS